MISEAELVELTQRMRENALQSSPPIPTPKRKGRTVTSEAKIASDCINILVQDGWRYLKTDPVSRRAWGKGFGEVGMADGLFIRYLGFTSSGGFLACSTPSTQSCADLAWIEWKREDGKPADHQSRWHEQERALGALTLIAGVDFPATVEGFMGWYKASGLQRKR